MGLQREGNSTGVRARRVVRPWPPRLSLRSLPPLCTGRAQVPSGTGDRGGGRCPVSCVCSLGRVSGGRRIGELVIDVPRASSGRRIGGDLAPFGGKLWRPGSVCAHAVSVYTGLGQVQPTEATSEGLGPLQLLGPGRSTGKSAPIQGSFLTGKPSRQRALETGFSPRITP